MEEIIRGVLQKNGLSQRQRGFRYFRKAAIYVLQHPDVLKGQKMSVLYPELSKIYNTTAQSVEHSMRYSLECAWENSNGNLREAFTERPATGKYLSYLIKEALEEVNRLDEEKKKSMKHYWIFL